MLKNEVKGCRSLQACFTRTPADERDEARPSQSCRFELSGLGNAEAIGPKILELLRKSVKEGSALLEHQNLVPNELEIVFDTGLETC